MTSIRESFEQGLTISVYGCTFELRTSAVISLESIIEHLPPTWRINPNDGVVPYRLLIETTAESTDCWKITINGVQSRQICGWGTLLDTIENAMQMYVAEFATPYLFVHAGVVAWNGTAILLPGRSFAGKSTLVTSLVQAGATYYSDEYAVLDDEGRVWPYRRRVSLRNGPHGPARRLDLARDDAPCEPLPVSLIALLQYTPGGSWHVERRTPGEAIMRLVDQTVAVRRRPADTLAYLGKAIEHATVIEGTRGEVEDTVPLILAAAEQANTTHISTART